MKSINLEKYCGIDNSPLKAGEVVQYGSGGTRTVVKTERISALIDECFKITTDFVNDTVFTMAYVKEHYDSKAVCKSREHALRVITSGTKLHDSANGLNFTIVFNSLTNEWWCVNSYGVSYMYPYHSPKNLSYHDMVSWFAAAGGVKDLNVIVE